MSIKKKPFDNLIQLKDHSYSYFSDKKKFSFSSSFFVFFTLEFENIYNVEVV
jgi:hypothetical protein